MKDSASIFALGAGAEGREEATSVESLVVLSETTAGESFTTFATSSICGMEQIRSSVARTISHLSIACGTCKSVPTRNGGNILYKRTGNTGPLVTFLLVPSAGTSV